MSTLWERGNPRRMACSCARSNLSACLSLMAVVLAIQRAITCPQQGAREGNRTEEEGSTNYIRVEILQANTETPDSILNGLSYCPTQTVKLISKNRGGGVRSFWLRF